VKVARTIAAVALAAVGVWCLFWVPLFAALASYAGDGWADFLALLATAVVFLSAAFLVQPLWRLPWRRGL
jgi:hypothetical protein